MPSILSSLAARLRAAQGKPVFLGELALVPSAGEWEIRQAADAEAGAGTLRVVEGLDAIRELSKTDEGGAYRPLRAAPGLRRGWRTRPLPLAALVAALNALYPAALGFWAAPERTPVVPFSETARRQTGMYRIVQTCGDAAPPLLAAVRGTCDGGCLRRRLWGPDSVAREEIAAETAPDAIPLLCPEACNYLVAKVREEIVARRAPEEGKA